MSASELLNWRSCTSRVLQGRVGCGEGLWSRTCFWKLLDDGAPESCRLAPEQRQE